MNVPGIKYFFMDLETTSASTDTAGITEIALVDPASDPATRVFHQYVIPNKTMRTKPASHYRNLGAAKFKKVFPSLIAWIQSKLAPNQKAVLIGHNIYKWDAPILEKHVEETQKRYIEKRSDSEKKKQKYDVLQHQFKLPPYIRYFDTLYLAKSLKVQGPLNLSDLCYKLGGEELVAHNALNDALMTQSVFEKLIGSAPAQEVLAPSAFGESHPVIKAREIIERYYKPETAVRIPYMNVTVPTAVKVDKLSFNVMDTETTGLVSPVAILQLGGYNPGTRSEFNELINPEGIPIHPKALEVHGISNEMVADAPPFKAVWLKAVQWRKSNVQPGQAEVVVGHNFEFFDLKRLWECGKRAGVWIDNLTTIDTLNLSRNLFKKEFIGKRVVPQGFHKLENLALTLGMESFEDAHDAVADCKATAFVLEKFLEGVPHEEIWATLQEFKAQPAEKRTPKAELLGRLIRKVGKFNPCLYLNDPEVAEQKKPSRKRERVEKEKSPAPVKKEKVVPCVSIIEDTDSEDKKTVPMEEDELVLFDK